MGLSSFGVGLDASLVVAVRSGILNERRSRAMSTYSVEELLNRWEREDPDPEQTIGHILQNLFRIEREVRQLKELLRKCIEKLKEQRQ
jgi:hypothetical protein